MRGNAGNAGTSERNRHSCNPSILPHVIFPPISGSERETLHFHVWGEVQLSAVELKMHSLSRGECINAALGRINFRP